MTLGLKNEGFELRLLNSLGFTFDLFLMYKLNETYQWHGYQGNRQLYRFFESFHQIKNLIFIYLL